MEKSSHAYNLSIPPHYIRGDNMPMMGGYGFGGFGIVFVIIYLGVVIYFFMLLTKISKSLQRIADKFERIKTEEK